MPPFKSPSSVYHLMPRVVYCSDHAAGNRDQPCASTRHCPHCSQVTFPAPVMGSCSPPTPALTHVLLTSAVSGHFSLCSAGSVHFDLTRPLTVSLLQGRPSDASCVLLTALQPETQLRAGSQAIVGWPPLSCLSETNLFLASGPVL